jgi:hypothetical protein
MANFGLPRAPGAPVLNAARAEASRRNGAKSRGPKTPEGKARSAQNALRHRFRAQKFLLLADEDGVAFAAFEAALLEELAPAGTLQSVLAQRLVVAAWRLNRADRMERDLLDEESGPDGDLGLALTRDGHGARVVPTLLRYRGAAMAEFLRLLRTLEALQARAPARAVLDEATEPTPPMPNPDEPELRGNPCDSGRPHGQVTSRDDPPQSPSIPSEVVEDGSASLLAGTALVPIGRRRYA